MEVLFTKYIWSDGWSEEFSEEFYHGKHDIHAGRQLDQVVSVEQVIRMTKDEWEKSPWPVSNTPQMGNSDTKS